MSRVIGKTWSETERDQRPLLSFTLWVCRSCRRKACTIGADRPSPCVCEVGR